MQGKFRSYTFSSSESGGLIFSSQMHGFFRVSLEGGSKFSNSFFDGKTTLSGFKLHAGSKCPALLLYIGPRSCLIREGGVVVDIRRPAQL